MHVGAAFAARDSPLYTMVGQEVMQLLAGFARLAAPGPEVLEVALEVVDFAKATALPAA